MSFGTDRVHHGKDQPVIQAQVMRKVAMRLIPFLALAYFLNYLDRTNISFAKLTMSEDLGLSETMYGLASGLFFIGYVFLEVPSNLALHRFGARRWIARIMVSWGLVAAAMAFVNSPTTLYIARILLGIAEAGFFPGIVLYLTFWFPRAVRVRLIGTFMIALPISSALGAPVSGVIIQYLDGVFGLAGWQMLFLLQGVPTVLLGVAAWFYLTDRPQHAKWLTAPEREWLAATIDAEHQAASDAGHVSVARTLRDPRVWALGVVYFGIAYGLFALSFFLPTIVGGLAKTVNTKFSILETGLIVAVPFACGAIAMVLWSRHSDRTGERLWHVALPALLAAVSIPLALYTNSPFATMAVISVTAIGIFCALPVFWYLPSTFLAGAGAAAGIALVNTLGAASGLVAPYVTGWLLDATGDSRAAMWLVGGFELVAAMAVLLLRRSIRAADTHRGSKVGAAPSS
ncbi:ACS family tartrate transporter-like MFS transporter [Arthrobacter ulcerisalmonis]|nr:MFS transporter [Arthrobacter ulcerisalmonis]MDQ0664576.1 ACS family tartrate transporter-like MFS transporter [Arthrobacter ulcerisalmonis]